MIRIFVCGDTHGLLNTRKLEKLIEREKLTYDDYVIICGDAGIVWSDESFEPYVEYYNNLGVNILFIDGNHENFSMLKTFPKEVWNGGITHKISDKIRYLSRGQVFNIFGRIILTLGGADSHDKDWRIEGESWWKDEGITYFDIVTAFENLKNVNNEVDYVLSHTPNQICANLLYEKFTQCGEDFPAYLLSKYNCNESGKILDEVANKVKFRKWFCGHWHIDEEVENYAVMYECVVEI